jgi:prepilin peptidase CpaA
MLFFDLFLVLFVLVAAGFDVWQYRIPNWLNLAAVAAGLFLSALSGFPRLIDSLFGLGLGVAILFGPFAFGWLGAGDVKFLAAVGAILGVGWIPRVFFYSALLGIPLALISIFLRGFDKSVFKRSWTDFKLFFLSRGSVLPDAITEKVSKGTCVIPYGVAIALATLIAYYGDPHGEWAGF